MKRVIAIDGPSGAGKSTISKKLASEFGFRYLDTGALYRAIALGLMQRGLNEGASESEIKSALDGMSISYSEGRVFLGGKDVEGEIRTPEVGHFSSVFSASRPVREFLMPVQKRAAELDELVAEGRDMTTVVFPDAWLKVYLDASVEARARRRYDQLREMGIEADMDRARRDVVERDERDSSRDLAPLKRADDALYVDSSSMNADEVVAAILKGAEQGAGK